MNIGHLIFLMKKEETLRRDNPEMAYIDEDNRAPARPIEKEKARLMEHLTLLCGFTYKEAQQLLHKTLKDAGILDI